MSNSITQILFARQPKALMTSSFSLCLTMLVWFMVITPVAVHAEFTLDFTLSGYSDDATNFGQVNCQQSGDDNWDLVSFPFTPTPVSGISLASSSSCTLEADLDPENSITFGVAGSSDPISISVNLADDDIDSPISGQTLQSIQLNDAYIMNYGITDFPAPQPDTAYLYVTKEVHWMEALQNSGYGNIKINQLVLPGSHDAGMYQLTDPLTSVANMETHCQGDPSTYTPGLGVLCFISQITSTAIGNLSLTQKDPISDQLRVGTRYFDMRPGQLVTDTAGDQTTTHVHNFIPGAHLSTMLGDISNFLQNATQEFVVLQIKNDGIDTTLFNYITQPELQTMLDNHIASDVGYEIMLSLDSFSESTLNEVISSGKRVLAIYEPASSNDNLVNDSYYPTSNYSTSMTDPSAVVGALDGTLNKCMVSKFGAYQYSLLQLQDTASEYLYNNFTSESLEVELSAIDDIGTLSNGNILHGTKPIFDAATYNWLVQQTTLNKLVRCNTPVVIQNDFVDGAMGAIAAGLSKYRYDSTANDVVIPSEVALSSTDLDQICGGGAFCEYALRSVTTLDHAIDKFEASASTNQVAFSFEGATSQDSELALTCYCHEGTCPILTGDDKPFDIDLSGNPPHARTDCSGWVTHVIQKTATNQGGRFTDAYNELTKAFGNQPKASAYRYHFANATTNSAWSGFQDLSRMGPGDVLAWCFDDYCDKDTNPAHPTSDTGHVMIVLAIDQLTSPNTPTDNIGTQNNLTYWQIAVADASSIPHGSSDKERDEVFGFWPNSLLVVDKRTYGSNEGPATPNNPCKAKGGVGLGVIVLAQWEGSTPGTFHWGLVFQDYSENTFTLNGPKGGDFKVAFGRIRPE